MVSAGESPAPRRRIVVGNWKMNGSRAGNAALLAALREAGPYQAEVAVCVPAPHLGDTAAQLAGSQIAWGGQDCSAEAAGAFTGETSAAMLAEFGCRFVIVGHSERRALHREGDALVAAKAAQALALAITPIVCVGESLAERDAAQTDAVIARQLGAVIERLGPGIGKAIVAYEPVWAIGTGRTASPEQAQSAHARLRAALAAAGAPGVPILYGGSVKPDNAEALFAEADVDGGLIGGASLNAAHFAAICRAA